MPHIPEALAEVNRAMMDGKRQVREMSSMRGRHAIEYKDGRKVLLVEVTEDAAPEAVKEWGGSRTSGMLLHKFHGMGPAVQGADYRAECNKGTRWYARPLSQHEGPRLRSREEIEGSEYADLYTFCPRCESK